MIKPDDPASGRPPSRRSHDSGNTPPPAQDEVAKNEEDVDYVIPAGDESDESELLKAIQDVVELAGHKPAAAAPATDLELPAVEADDLEKTQTIRDVVELAGHRKPPATDEVPALELPGGEVDDLERKRAIEDVVKLAGRRQPPSKDTAPDLVLSAREAADDLEKTRAIKEVLELTARRRVPAKEVIPESERPVLTLSAVEAADDLEKRRAILEVVEHAARTTRAVFLAKPIESYRSRPIMLALLAIPSFVLGLYTFIGRPEYVFGPNPANAAPAKREAHLRFAMFLVAQRLDAYRNTHRGQLPPSLAEAGENWPGIGYRIVGDSVFELRARDDSAGVISLRSDQPLNGFLGESRSHLRELRP